jgi:hypothetical protein
MADKKYGTPGTKKFTDKDVIDYRDIKKKKKQKKKKKKEENYKDYFGKYP